MKIIVDAMGGDNAPSEIVRGAADAQAEFGIDLILVGREDQVEECLSRHESADRSRIRVVDATQAVKMDDDANATVRGKKDSSMAVALRLLRDGGGDGVVSAGNTGALLTGATLIVKRVRGIRRAALAPVIPNGAKGVLLIDCGANTECTPEYLLQFAFMGSYYAKKAMGIENPRIGLLNVGTEDTKGTQLHKQSYSLLKAARETGEIHFVGNVEGSGLFADQADVLVADGFSGNILLKSVEGTAGFLMSQLKGVFTKNLKTKLAASMVLSGFRGLKSMMDASEIGGTALLGISKPVIKAHGSSNARAIRSAVMQAIQFANSGMIEDIAMNIERMKAPGEGANTRI